MEFKRYAKFCPELIHPITALTGLEYRRAAVNYTHPNFSLCCCGTIFCLLYTDKLCLGHFANITKIWGDTLDQNIAHGKISC